MFERVTACGLAAMTLVIAAPLAAQDDAGFAERERALARELAEQEERSDSERVAAQRAQAERQAMQQQQQQQRELAREYEAQQREFVAQQAEQQRSLAREFEARQRQATAQQEDYARQTRELARELSKAKSELQVSAMEIARLSAQLSGNAMGDAMRNVENNQGLILLAQGSALGINVQDTDGGVRVNGVTPNGPAAAAGVAVGDTIVAIDGVELDGGAGTAELLARMADVEPGDDVELRIRRGNDARVVVVEATENGWRGFRPFYRDGLVTLATPAPRAAPAATAWSRSPRLPPAPRPPHLRRPRRRSSSVRAGTSPAFVGPGATWSSCR
jgi:C-terminal processing protease CtpA/Prc